MRTDTIALLVALVFFASPGAGASSYDPHVEPSSPLAGQHLAFWALLPGMSCFTELIVHGVAASGTEITISYSIVATEQAVCFTVEPPLVLNEPIGTFWPGSYTVRALGDFEGVPVDPIVASFVIPSSPVAAIEYYRSDADHYFVTSDANEIAKLDAGDFAGWKRTGESFAVIPASMALVAPWSPVCRFYGKPEAGLDSHFHSASPAECQVVIDRFSSAWLFEAADVFAVQPPNAIDGRCASGTVPVYRLFNNRADANHRYTTSIAIRNQMAAAGWIAEGYGSDPVAMCAP